MFMLSYLCEPCIGSSLRLQGPGRSRVSSWVMPGAGAIGPLIIYSPLTSLGPGLLTASSDCYKFWDKVNL